MSSLALQRGPGSAYPDLPPTLQPHAIASAAPRPDHLRNLGLSGTVYLLLAVGVILLSAARPRVIPIPIPPTEPTRVVELRDLPRPPVPRLPPSLPPALGGGGGTRPTQGVTAPARPEDPVEAPAGLPAQDRWNQLPAGFGAAGPAPSNAPAGIGFGSGPVIQELGPSALAVVRQVEPAYPDFARRAHIQGAVVLHMVVDEAGQPVRVEVLEGHPVFHQVAVQAARQWRFEPARIDGRPVSASFRLTLKFSLR